MSSEHKYQVYVVVFKGDPIDFSKYRHTGLLFVPGDRGAKYYFHVMGCTGYFTIERRKNFDPTTSRTFAKKIEIGKTRLSLTSDELTTLLESVQVNNDDAEFNCQQWIQYALEELLRQGYLEEEQYNDGWQGMVDAITEAEDEDLA